MYILDLKNEAALDALADLIEPLSEIATDEDFQKALKSNNKPKAIANLIRKHKSAIISVCALVEGEDPETCNISVLTLPSRILQILNTPEIMSLFQFAEPKNRATSSGSAMANTEANAQ